MFNGIGRKRNLVMVIRRPEDHMGTYSRMADYVRERAPEVRPTIVEDVRVNRWRRLAYAARPTLVYCPVPLDRLRLSRGRVFQGIHIPKSEEYKRLEAYGLPVPKWRLMKRSDKAPPDLDGFGPYVVVKPDMGRKGAQVRIRRRGRVRWTELPSYPEKGHTDLLAQEFVYTGPWPVSYRISTLFGEILYAMRLEASRDRRPLEGRDGFHKGGGMSIVSSATNGSWTPTEEPDVLDLAVRAHEPFPEHPLLAVDLVRDYETGKLCVVEVNTAGWSWHFSSRIGRSIQKANGIDFDAQFGGLSRAADALIRTTRLHAR